LINNEIKIKKIEDNRLIGNYKEYDINIKCLFRQGCFMIMENEIIKFEKELKEKEIIGFLVSNVYFSKKVIDRVENNDRIYICHENEIVNTIKNVEEYKNIKNIVKNFKILLRYQKEMIQHQKVNK
jgi:hypothetical protein